MNGKNAHRARVDGVIEIALVGGQVALIDAQDWEKVHAYRWRAAWDPHARTFRARCNVWEGGKRGKCLTILMHRLILAADPGQQIDHVNHNGVDNRRCNIRLCTQTENRRNARKGRAKVGRFKGVHWHKQRKRWQAAIRAEGRSIYLGIFDDEAEAARAYDAAARKLFGEFACTNGEA